MLFGDLFWVWIDFDGFWMEFRRIGMDFERFWMVLDGFWLDFGSSPSRMWLCILSPEVQIVSISTRAWPSISSPVSRMHLFILYPQLCISIYLPGSPAFIFHGIQDACCILSFQLYHIAYPPGLSLLFAHRIQDAHVHIFSAIYPHISTACRAAGKGLASFGEF